MMLRMLSASGGVGDVFFFISHTGRTRVLVEAAELARQTEATLVSLTREILLWRHRVTVVLMST